MANSETKRNAIPVAATFLMVPPGRGKKEGLLTFIVIRIRWQLFSCVVDPGRALHLRCVVNPPPDQDLPTSRLKPVTRLIITVIAESLSSQQDLDCSCALDYIPFQPAETSLPSRPGLVSVLVVGLTAHDKRSVRFFFSQSLEQGANAARPSPSSVQSIITILHLFPPSNRALPLPCPSKG